MKRSTVIGTRAGVPPPPPRTCQAAGCRAPVAIALAPLNGRAGQLLFSCVAHAPLLALRLTDGTDVVLVRAALLLPES